MILVRLLPFLFLIPSLHAGYVDNLASPMMLDSSFLFLKNRFIKIKTGYLTDQVANKKMIARSGSDIENSYLHSFATSSHYATAALALFNTLELYGNLGASKEKIEWNPETSGHYFSSATLDEKSSFRFSWNLGATLVFKTFRSFVMGFNFNYFRIPSSRALSFDWHNIHLSLNLSARYFHYQEWHTALGISTKIGPFSPYAGGKYLRSGLKILTNNSRSIYFRNRNRPGAFLGMSLIILNKMSINAEYRFHDERAYSISAQSNF